MGSRTTIRYFLDTYSELEEFHRELEDLYEARKDPGDGFDMKAWAKRRDELLRIHPFFGEFDRSEIKINMGDHLEPIHIIPNQVEMMLLKGKVVIPLDIRFQTYIDNHEQGYEQGKRIIHYVRVVTILPLPPGETRKFGMYRHGHAFALVLWDHGEHAYRIVLESWVFDDLNALLHNITFGLIEPISVEPCAENQ